MKLALFTIIITNFTLVGCYQSKKAVSERSPANELGLSSTGSQPDRSGDRNIKLTNRESYELCIETVNTNGGVEKVIIRPNSSIRIPPSISFVRISTLNENSNSSDYRVFRYGNLRESSSAFFNRETQKWEFGTPQYGINPNSKPLDHRPHDIHSNLSVPVGTQTEKHPCNI